MQLLGVNVKEKRKNKCVRAECPDVDQDVTGPSPRSPALRRLLEPLPDAAAAPFFSPPLSSYLMFSPHQETSLSADDWRSRRDEADDRNQNILWLNFAAYCVTPERCECCCFCLSSHAEITTRGRADFSKKKKKRKKIPPQMMKQRASRRRPAFDSCFFFFLRGGGAICYWRNCLNAVCKCLAATRLEH